MLQELFRAAGNACILWYWSFVIMELCRALEKPYFFGGQSLAGEVVATCRETLFYNVGIHFKEVLHL